MRRFLICGTRDRRWEAEVFKRLRERNMRPKEILLIHGDCPSGADAAAARFAEMAGFDQVRVPANWNGRGDAAGPFRNQLMLDLLKPEIVIAFPVPSSRGTRDMVRRAEAAAITTEIYELGKHAVKETR